MASRRNEAEGDSSRVVYRQTTTSGFHQRVFVMFHSTTAENAKSILQEGFNLSNESDNRLGQGIYASSDIDKAQRYGPVTFKMLVYPGRVKVITRQSDGMRTNWKLNYGSAWVPPNSSMALSGRQENCMKSPRQVKILGVITGYDDLDEEAQSMSMCRDLTSHLSPHLRGFEKKALRKFKRDLGLVYAPIEVGHDNQTFYLGVRSDFTLKWSNSEPEEEDTEFYWTSTYDHFLENRAYDQVLFLNDDMELELVDYDYLMDEDGGRSKKFRIDRHNSTLYSYERRSYLTFVDRISDFKMRNCSSEVSDVTWGEPA